MLGRVLDLLPDFMLQRLARVGGKWDHWSYCSRSRCFTGHITGSGSFDLATATSEAGLLRALSGEDPEFALPSGMAEKRYLALSERLGDARAGQLIERRAARILADRAAERDLAHVASRASYELVGPGV